MELALSRDPATGKVTVTGYTGSKVPQLILRERVHGKFLTATGWQLGAGIAPLVAVPEQDGSYFFDVDGKSLPPGTHVQLEIPASSHRQEAVWPPDLDALEQALIAEPIQPAARALRLGVRTPALPPAKRKQATTASQPTAERPTHWAIVGILFVGAALSGAAIGWAWSWHDKTELSADLDAARTRLGELESQAAQQQSQRDADRAAFAREVGEINLARAELIAARQRLAAEQKALTLGRSELEAQKAQLAAEQARFEQTRQGQTPASSPSAGMAGLPVPMPGLAGAPGAAFLSPAVQEAAAQCDLLAANPLDRNRTPGMPGVKMLQLKANAATAIDACRQASNALPDQLNYTYQFARALQSSTPEQAVPLLEQLIQQRYPAAFDNMAWVALNRDNNYRKAAFYLRQGVALNDPGAMYTLALLLRDDKISRRANEDYRALLRRAADLGSDDALITLNEDARPRLPFRLPWLR